MTFRLTASLIGLLIAALVLTNGCSKAPDACRTLQGSEKSKCIIDAAVEQRDARLCEQFKDNVYNAWCFTDVANATKSTAPCEGIIDPRSREFCRRDIFLMQGDVRRCSELIHVPARESCLEGFARLENDWRICLDIAPGDFREQCIDRESRAAADPVGCLELDPLGTRHDACLFSLSISALNADTCANLTSSESAAYCVLNVAVRQKNETLCARVPNVALCKELVRQNAT
jgi:hypothetical protein